MRLKKIKHKYYQLKNFFEIQNSGTLYLSFGENCLTDGVLDRHKLKSFSTPYSNGRSNIEIILQLEKDSYAHLLDKDYLVYEKINGKTVVRNKYYLDFKNIYNLGHQKGFEFTHSDVITNNNSIKSYIRKINRLNKFRGRKNFKLYYHHRTTDRSNLNFIIQKAEELAKFYAINNKSCKVIVFYQNIIEDKSKRKLIVNYNSKNVIVFVFYTLELWDGDIDNVFWARVDDDLLAEMIHTTKNMS